MAAASKPRRPYTTNFTPAVSMTPGAVRTRRWRAQASTRMAVDVAMVDAFLDLQRERHVEFEGAPLRLDDVVRKARRGLEATGMEPKAAAEALARRIEPCLAPAAPAAP